MDTLVDDLFSKLLTEQTSNEFEKVEMMIANKGFLKAYNDERNNSEYWLSAIKEDFGMEIDSSENFSSVICERFHILLSSSTSHQRYIPEAIFLLQSTRKYSGYKYKTKTSDDTTAENAEARRFLLLNLLIKMLFKGKKLNLIEYLKEQLPEDEEVITGIFFSNFCAYITFSEAFEEKECIELVDTGMKYFPKDFIQYFSGKSVNDLPIEQVIFAKRGFYQFSIHIIKTMPDILSIEYLNILLNSLIESLVFEEGIYREISKAIPSNLFKIDISLRSARYRTSNKFFLNPENILSPIDLIAALCTVDIKVTAKMKEMIVNSLKELKEESPFVINFKKFSEENIDQIEELFAQLY